MRFNRSISWAALTSEWIASVMPKRLTNALLRLQRQASVNNSPESLVLKASATVTLNPTRKQRGFAHISERSNLTQPTMALPRSSPKLARIECLNRIDFPLTRSVYEELPQV